MNPKIQILADEIEEDVKKLENLDTSIFYTEIGKINNKIKEWLELEKKEVDRIVEEQKEVVKSLKQFFESKNYNTL